MASRNLIAERNSLSVARNIVGSTANSIANTAGISANNAESMIDFFNQNRDYNNAWSASQARLQREWQEQQNAKAMLFNASEAQKNRDWQEMMSNTAHQREMADLKAAGLNPILSAMNGNGASVTSGATASGVTSAGSAGQTDNSVNQMVMTLMSSFLDAQTKLAQTSMNAVNNLAVSEKNGEMARLLENLKHTNEVYLRENFPNDAYSAVTAVLYALGLNPDGERGSKLFKGVGNAIDGFFKPIGDAWKESSLGEDLSKWWYRFWTGHDKSD